MCNILPISIQVYISVHTIYPHTHADEHVLNITSIYKPLQVNPTHGYINNVSLYFVELLL